MLQEVKENWTKLLPERSHVSQEQGHFPILAGLIVGTNTTPGRWGLGTNKCGRFQSGSWGSGFHYAC